MFLYLAVLWSEAFRFCLFKRNVNNDGFGKPLRDVTLLVTKESNNEIRLKARFPKSISIALHTALSHLDKRNTYVGMLFTVS